MIDAAKRLGWRVVHYRAAQVRDGRWATPLQGHPGAPDLILAKAGRVLLVELKTRTGKVSAAQTLWLDALGEHGAVWRPGDQEQVLAVLAA